MFLGPGTEYPYPAIRFIQKVTLSTLPWQVRDFFFETGNNACGYYVLDTFCAVLTTWVHVCVYQIYDINNIG